MINRFSGNPRTFGLAVTEEWRNEYAEISKAKYDVDVVGHDARPDVFRLYVNERPMLPVVMIADDPEDLFGTL